MSRSILFLPLFWVALIIFAQPDRLAAPSLSCFPATAAAHSRQSTADNNLFRSDDGGGSWAPVGALPKVFVLAVDPLNRDTIYAVNPDGLHKSVDGGSVWSRIDGQITEGRVTAIAIDPRAPSTLYATTFIEQNVGAVFKSADGGGAWNRSNAGLGNRLIGQLVIDPVNTGTLYAAALAGGIFKTTDGGETWSQLSNSPSFFAHGSSSLRSIFSLAIAPGDPSTLYTGTGGAGNAPIPPALYKTTDGGAGWRLQSLTGVISALAVDSRDASIAYATSFSALEQGLFKTTDGGNWSRLSLDFLPSTLVIDPLNSSVVYAVSQKTPGRGVYKSVDGGQSWRSSSAGLPDLSTTALAIAPGDPARLYAGVTPDPTTGPVSNVSAANFSGTALAQDSIVAAFGTSLADVSEQATSLPLPTTLGGTTVSVKDSAGVERAAALFFVSRNQVNYLMPPGAAAGQASVTVTSRSNFISTGATHIVEVSPGIFAFDQNGLGITAAVALRVKADGAQSYEAVARFDSAQNGFVTIPIDLGPESDQVYLVVFGTGWRHRASLSAVVARIGGVDAQVTYAGAHPTLAGLDQLNVRLPRSLAGRGDVYLSLTVDGRGANANRVNVR